MARSNIASGRIFLALAGAVAMGLLAGILIWFADGGATDSAGLGGWGPTILGILGAGLVYSIAAYFLLKKIGVNNAFSVLALGVLVGWVLSVLAAWIAVTLVGNSGWGLAFSLGAIPAALSLCGVVLANKLIGTSSTRTK
jgi:hypothetical protein